MTDFVKLGFDVESRPFVTADDRLNRFNRRATETTRVTGRATQKVNTFGASFRTVALGAAGAAAAIGGVVLSSIGIGRGISTLADFGASMSQVQAITGATAEEMEVLRAVAKDLGASTEFTASQAADGLRFLGMAGFEASEAIAAIPAVLDLATTSGLGLGQAADIASNVLSGFGLAAQDAAMVTDVLAATASRANTDVSQLGRAMSFVAPVAAAAGVSVSEAAAAIGILGDAGIQATRAGTAVRQIMSQLAAPTAQAQEAMQSLGLTAAQLDPTANSLTTIMQRLSDANIGLADASRLVGIEASSALLALTSQSASLTGLTEELQDVDGAAQQMAATFRDNLRGDLAAAGSAAQALVLALGDAGLTDALRSAVQTVTEFLRVLAGVVDGTVEAEGAVRALSYAVAILGARFLPGLAVATAGAAVRLGTFATAMVVSAARTTTLTTALVGLRAILIRTGIGALVVGAGELIFQFSRLVRAAGGFGEAIALLRDVGNEVWERMTFGVQAFGMAHAAVFFQFKADAASAMASSIQAVLEFGNIASNIFEGTLGAIKALWGTLPSVIGNLVFQAANALIDGVEAMLNGVSSRIDSFITKINGALDALPGNLAPQIGTIGEIDLGEIENKYKGAGTVAGRSAKEAFKAAFDDNPFEASTPGLDRVSEEASANAQFYRTATADLAAGAATALQSWRRLQEVMAGTDAVADEALIATGGAVEALAAAVEEIDTADPLGSIADGAGGATGKVKELKDELDDVETVGTRTSQLLQNAFSGIFDDPKNALESFAKSLAELVLQTQLFRLLSSALPGVFGADGFAPLPSFAGGGDTGNGPRSGGLDGRGGFLAMMHPQETVTDRTKGAPSGSGVEVNIIGAPPGTTSERRTGPDGREVVDVQVGRGITQGRQDSAFRSRMGIQPPVARR